jgi:hypothetical protein
MSKSGESHASTAKAGPIPGHSWNDKVMPFKILALLEAKDQQSIGDGAGSGTDRDGTTIPTDLQET